MEPYRRSRFILYQIVHLSSETWIRLYFTAWGPGTCKNSVYAGILRFSALFCRLRRAISVSSRMIFRKSSYRDIIHYFCSRSNKPPKHPRPNEKIALSDVICPFEECVGNISGLTWICVVVVLLYSFFRVIKLTHNLYHFWDIKGFFNIALQIPDVSRLILTKTFVLYVRILQYFEIWL